MKMFLMVVWANFFGFSIFVGASLLFGGDPFFGYFAEKEERIFPICKRDLYSELGHDLIWKYRSYPVQSYEVVCGYIAAVAPKDYGEIRSERSTSENGKLVSSDTRIPGASYTVECTQFSDPPKWTSKHGWARIDENLYCPMPKQGESPPRG
jgi:hypothetical protein